MQSALRSPASVSVAFTGAGLIAIAPLASQISNVQISQSNAIATAVELSSSVTDAAEDWITAFGASAENLGGFVLGFPGQLASMGQHRVCCTIR